jgi:hypothetical protein
MKEPFLENDRVTYKQSVIKKEKEKEMFYYSYTL